ncbi:hypothetical protein CcaCcLH18_14307 [Colletotrichum camelliae]|nr:hypothetical protein CcaCcLH18_14307 [Colletotrichum camelliae]
MSQPQTFESSNPGVQQPAVAHDRESVATTMQGTGPAPAKEMPTSLINTDEPTSTPWASQKHDGPTIEALPPPPTVTPLHALGDTPQPIDCPFCKKRTQTTITKEGTSMQMVAGILCCLLCVCLTCVPCIAGWCEDVHYACSSCHKRVATRPYNGTIQTFGPQSYAPIPSQYASTAPPVAEKQAQ